ncbi:amino acid ABC transporter permease [Bacilliculturomica massiliensis]|uniref:amino acid ABC transporter permease n=1 Tax=Bacilliculturomica massiliensis TaxID=1917867 RepID=UPI0013EF38B4|nr:amino acid ABC transporter permease [Bacilliculturomica massiliensis]
MFLDWLFPIYHLPELLRGAAVTLETSAAAFLFSFFLGMLFAIVRFHKKPLVLYPIVTAFVEVFRNTPLLVQLFFIYFGFPQFGIMLSPMQAGMLGLVANSASYYSEILRGGIQSIPKGQWEAADCLGLSRPQVFTRIICPQVIRDTFPSITNQMVLVIFGTSVLSILDVKELTQVASILNSQSFRSMEIFTFVMLLYYGVTTLALAVCRFCYRRWFAAKTERR